MALILHYLVPLLAGCAIGHVLAHMYRSFRDANRKIKADLAEMALIDAEMAELRAIYEPIDYWPVVDEGTCPHDSMSGDEGPVALLGRMPVRWRCEACDAIVYDDANRAVWPAQAGAPE